VKDRQSGRATLRVPEVQILKTAQRTAIHGNHAIALVQAHRAGSLARPLNDVCARAEFKAVERVKFNLVPGVQEVIGAADTKRQRASEQAQHKDVNEPGWYPPHEPVVSLTVVLCLIARWRATENRSKVLTKVRKAG